MLKRLLITCAVLCSTIASAQSVTYVRPSKGKSLTVFKNIPVSNTGSTQELSAVYDWSAFSSVQVRVEVTGYDPNSGLWPDLTSCVAYPVIEVLGSPELTTTVTSYTTETDPTGRVEVQKQTYSYAVGNLSPYIRLKLTGAYPTLGFNVCNATVTIVPLPFDQNVRDIFAYVQNNSLVKFRDLSPRMVGGLKFSAADLVYLQYPYGNTFNASEVVFNRYDRNYAQLTTGGVSSPVINFSAPITVGSATQVEVFNIDAITYGDPLNQNVSSNNVTIENVGTQPAYCAFTAKSPFSANPPAVTPSNFTFTLKACGVAKDGTGGTKTFNSIIRPYSAIRCITAAGTTDIAVQKF